MFTSGKEKLAYEKFKAEATVTILKSKSGEKKKFIKFRGKTFQTGSLQNAFLAVKESLMNEVR
jgi:hypothetical protein